MMAGNAPRRRSGSGEFSKKRSLPQHSGLNRFANTGQSIPFPVEHEEEEEEEDDDDDESVDGYAEAGTASSPLQAVIALQSFEGSWQWESKLLTILGLDGKTVEKSAPETDMAVLATALAVRFLETKLADEKESWELVAEKARRWIEERVGAQGLKDAFALAEKTLV
jgi:hypothetical protein